MEKRLVLIPLFLMTMLLLPSISGAIRMDEAEERFIVIFKEGTDPDLVLDEDSVQMDLDIINGAAIMATPGYLKKLEKTGKLESISLDHPIEATVETSYSRLPWGVNWIDSDWVWNHESNGVSDGINGEGINVAVLDTGIDLDHPDLTGSIGAGINFVAVTNPAGRIKSPADPLKFDDDNGHGTHCAGIIAAEEANPSQGAIGVARGATVHPVKVLDSRGSGLTSYLVKGIEWCTDTYLDSNLDPIVDVISMSLSSSYPDPAVKTACDNAANKGIILVAAAGNDGDGDVDTDEIEYPASFDSVISVGAADLFYNIAGFSSSSPYVDISAPGVNIWSTYIGGGYSTKSGTSMAAPHIAGTVALMLKKGISTSNIKSALQTTAHDIGPTGTDSASGAGFVDALLAVGWSDVYSPMIIDWEATAGENTATVTFYTDEFANARIEYYEDGAPETTFFSSWTSGLIFHTISISGLTSGTKYIYKVHATDGAYAGVQEGAAGSAEFTTTGGTTPLPEDEPMHVKDITATTTTRGSNKFINSKVLIEDESGNVVEGATVTISITLSGSSVASSSSITGSDGYASFSNRFKTGGTYKITVSNVVKTGYTYDSSSDIVKELSVTI